MTSAQDNPVILNDLVFVIEQSFNRRELLDAMNQFHTDTQVGIMINMVHGSSIYTASAQDYEATWLKRELGVSIFITLDDQKAYQHCKMQVTSNSDVLLSLEDQQRIREDLMEYYFLNDPDPDDACTQGLLAGIAAIREKIMKNKDGGEVNNEEDIISRLEEGDAKTNEEDQSGQREELIAEILRYLQQRITAWQSDNKIALPKCISVDNDLIDPVLEQISYYQAKPSELFVKYSKGDQSALSVHIGTYDSADNPVSYQEALSEETWQTITCRTYSYLNDLAQGVGEIAEVSAAKTKLENFISRYRTAYQQSSTNFNLNSTNFGDVYPMDYFIQGVSSIKVGLVDLRESNDYESSLSLGYSLEDVVGKKSISGRTFESSAVFRFGKPGWNFMDGPKFLLYSHHSEPARGLDSKTLLEDYLPGKYDYEAVQNFVNKIIDSHDQGEESLDMRGKLSGQQVYARNVNFGDKGVYDLYITRTGEFKKDHNSFYGYTKTEASDALGFTGSYTEYKFHCKSGGVTYLIVPETQADAFESSVLKLHSVSSGTAHLDLLHAIRAANLNADTKLDITKYGSEGGLSPVFEINHDEEKLRLMVAYPLLGNKKNKIDPSRRPEPVAGQTDNAVGKAGSWVIYEFQNEKGKAGGHNTKVYVKATQMELFESYLLIAQEVLVEGITWRSQFDSYFKGRTCYPSKACCMQASLEIIKQFNVTTSSVHRTNIATLVAPETDYNTLIPTAEFEAQVEYIDSSIKPNKQGGKPILVGVHYNKGKKPYNVSNPATYHFVVIVGRGYDKEKRKHYYRFYEVGTSDKILATGESNKLYIDNSSRFIRGAYEGKTYTITEVRKNK